MAQAERELVGLERIPEDQWAFYQEVIRTVREQGHPVVLGGAFALATYTGQSRNTKDLDLYILRDARDDLAAALDRIGVHDLFDEEEYQRHWIYRSTRDGFIVDLIWGMANSRAFTDEGWLSRGPKVTIRGERVRILPVEEMLWAKLYIIHKERCDWPDVLNLLYNNGQALDWEHLIEKMGADVPLLAGVLSVFAWMCPGRAAAFPRWLWERVGLGMPGLAGSKIDRQRVDWIDSRPWFIPMLEEGEEPFSPVS